MESTEGTRAPRSALASDGAARARRGAVDPRGRSEHEAVIAAGLSAATRCRRKDGSLELDAMKKRGARCGPASRRPRVGSPMTSCQQLAWDLAGDQQRASIVAVVDDLVEVATLLGFERLRPPIVDDQQPDAFRAWSAAAACGLRRAPGPGVAKQAAGAFVEHRGSPPRQALWPRRRRSPTATCRCRSDRRPPNGDDRGPTRRWRAFWNRGRGRDRAACRIDVLDRRRPVASFASRRRRASRLFSRLVASRSTSSPSQSSRVSSWRPRARLPASSIKASAMAVRPSARRRSTVGWISIFSPFNVLGQW